MWQIILFADALLRSWGMGGIFASMFIENIAIPLPIEIGYITALQMIDAGQYGYWFMLAFLTLGQVAGAIGAYGVGKYAGEWLERRFSRRTQFHDVRTKVADWYTRFGDATAFLVRFNGYLRLFSSYVAGIAQYSFRRFVFWTAVGSLLFNIGALALSRILVMAWQRYAVWHVLIGTVLTVSFFGGIVLALLHRHIVRRRKTHQEMNIASPKE